MKGVHGGQRAEAKKRIDATMRQQESASEAFRRRKYKFWRRYWDAVAEPQKNSLGLVLIDTTVQEASGLSYCRQKVIAIKAKAKAN